jgi:hypothetical protein
MMCQQPAEGFKTMLNKQGTLGKLITMKYCQDGCQNMQHCQRPKGMFSAAKTVKDSITDAHVANHAALKETGCKQQHHHLVIAESAGNQ